MQRNSPLERGKKSSDVMKKFSGLERKSLNVQGKLPSQWGEMEVKIDMKGEILYQRRFDF